MTGRGTDAELAAAYRHCRAIAAEHGRTYFLATRLLSPPQRSAVHALYAFARTVDDVVDRAESTCDAVGFGALGAQRSAAARDRASVRTSSQAAPDSGNADLAAALRLDRIDTQLRTALKDAGLLAEMWWTAAGTTEAETPLAESVAIDAPVLAALVDTVARYSIAPDHFRVFLDAMRMDVPGSPLFRNRYADMGELREYMRGSAAAIGLQLLPILGTVVPVAEAEPAAAALGEAFQLTNFLRDVAEDLDRGRIYLPGDELAAFGIDADLLAHCRRTGRTDPRVRRALAHLIATNRAVYRTAAPGIDLLRPRVRPAIRTAAVLYGGILDEIERHDYAVFDRRATVPTARRLRVAVTELGSGLRRPANPSSPLRAPLPHVSHTAVPRAFGTARPNAPRA
ncbi:phytoene/squalene synthase family protein [Nocardia sp. 852002-20019_SCH5090214]|uniref:phytoene/squalene synthase family protein n=1 Tax=Nocardia sp. 852002-20019_SCH5090214 TaxID=1834087 RepID=UPI0009EE90E5|nr:phytoene/squalene synthase family protein [Nocardia sp. 852002-20019_SCH5090214]